MTASCQQEMRGCHLLCRPVRWAAESPHSSRYKTCHGSSRLGLRAVDERERPRER